MEYTVATVKDIPQLVEMRLSYLREDYGGLTEEQEMQISKQLPTYFEMHLNKDIWGFIVKEGATVLSTALLYVQYKPANPSFPTGKVGDVLNVYTRPEYRHQGMAKSCMTKLLAYAKEENLDYVELSATEDGYPLYKALGFQETQSHYRAMKYYMDVEK